jgi:quinol monooxygenase YgiN
MTAFAIMVKFTLKDGTKEKFMEAALYDAEHSMRDEPACQQFRVLTVDDDPNTVYFLEIYDNEEALDVHRQQPHYAVYSKVAAELGVERERTVLTLQNP